jgi:hypothetical protein
VALGDLGAVLATTNGDTVLGELTWRSCIVANPEPAKRSPLASTSCGRTSPTATLTPIAT